MKAWVIRAGGKDQPDVTPCFWKHSVAAIGWQIGNLSQVSNREEIKARLRHRYPGWESEDEKVRQIAGNLYRFIFEISVGDLIVTPQPNRGREVLIGCCAGQYEYRPGLIKNDEDMRAVHWQKKVIRKELSGSLQNSLAERRLTVSDISQHIDEIKAILAN